MSAKLKRIALYPIKSFSGIYLDRATIKDLILCFDRHYLLTNYSGEFITSRFEPKLLLFKTRFISGGIKIIAPDNSVQTITPLDFSSQPELTNVWGRMAYSRVASIKINRWLSNCLNRDVQLRWLGGDLHQQPSYVQNFPFSFSDRAPISLINDASFQSIAAQCKKSISYARFRANLIVTGVPAFEEDHWKIVQIGEIQFDVIKPTSRCLVTTYDPENALPDVSLHPLSVLKRMRNDGKGHIDFGIYLIPRNSGTLFINDKVHIIEVKTPRVYITESPIFDNSQFVATSEEEQCIGIEYKEYRFDGNTQQTLLEQLEGQQISLPYSCRAGICGKCEVELVAGDVIPLTQTAIKKDKKILACSCRPNGPLKIR